MPTWQDSRIPAFVPLFIAIDVLENLPYVITVREELGAVVRIGTPLLAGPAATTNPLFLNRIVTGLG